MLSKIRNRNKSCLQISINFTILSLLAFFFFLHSKRWKNCDRIKNISVKKAFEPCLFACDIMSDDKRLFSRVFNNFESWYLSEYVTDGKWHMKGYFVNYLTFGNLWYFHDVSSTHLLEATIFVMQFGQIYRQNTGIGAHKTKDCVFF